MIFTDDIFDNVGLEIEDLEEAEIDKATLLEIINDYDVFVHSLTVQARYFSDILHMCSDINSVKWRIKDPTHLLLKIVRKRKEAIQNDKRDSSKYMNIIVGNYKEIVNDLIGLRAIYLFKTQWKPIDTYIFENFKVCNDEAIKIYHAEDDNISHYPDCKEDMEIEFKGQKYIYTLERKGSRYRSTHYTIEGIPPNNYKFELQTRTILDEAWGEIDHHIRYPAHENNPELIRRMSILNGALSSCEEHVTNFNEYYLSLEVEESSTVMTPKAQHINFNENQETDEKNEIESSVDEPINEKLDISSNVPSPTITAVKNPNRLSEIARLGVDPFTEMTRQSVKAQIGSLAETIRKAQERTCVHTLSRNIVMNPILNNPSFSSLAKNTELLNKSVLPITNPSMQSAKELARSFESPVMKINSITNSLKPIQQESEKLESLVNPIFHKLSNTKK